MKECPACKRCFPDEINHCPLDGDATTPSLFGEPILDARYQLERRLGQGGMGVVFQARHIFLKTSHAIKVILPDLVGNDPMLVTRFRQEALAAAAIRHQNIIAVTDFGVVRGTMPFLVMEFVSGKSLQDILGEEGAMSPARAFEFMTAIGRGVAAAHRQNIVHRDLKPLNIMVQENVPIAEGVKILDFGLAKIKSGELLGSFVQAKTTGLMGSPFYMAPEQWSDEEPDSRADIYSLGIILYQMLSGDVPFKGASIPSIMKKHLTLPPPSFQSLGVDVPPQIEAVVRHALEKEIEQRTSTVEDFLREIREAITSAGVSLHRPTRERRKDPNRTMVGQTTNSSLVADETGYIDQPNVSETAFEPQGGTAVLAGQTIASNEAYRLEQEQKELIARQELDREAEARRKFEEEVARKRKEEDERLLREREEREAAERQHREQLERVSRQAAELEDRLARLSTSISPQTSGVDGRGTQIEPGVHTQAGQNSFSGAQSGFQQSQATFDQPARASRSPLLIAGIAFLVLVVVFGGGLGAYLIYRSTITPPIEPRKDPDKPTEPVVLKPTLVEITGGIFNMGRDDGPAPEQPAHQVKVDGFHMDVHEITNAEYAEFVKEAGYKPPAHWVETGPVYGQENWPVVNVSLDDANAFAAWRSNRDGVTYRLPTEAEWEFAARNGQQQDVYPWGMTWNDSNAVLLAALPAAVGSKPQGNNSLGIADLIGNVWEWTSSKASVYPGNPATVPADIQGWVAVRGGGYATDPSKRDSPVSACMREFVPPSTRTPLIGFRLVRSAESRQ